MMNRSYVMSNLSNIQSDRSLIDLRNQYSILNRLKNRDILANFSMDLQYKLPRINNRIKNLNDKQNELSIRQSRIMDKSVYIKLLEDQVDTMKKHLLSAQKNKQHACFCNSKLPYILPMPYSGFMPQNHNHLCPNCGKSNQGNQNQEVVEKKPSLNKNPKNRRNLLKKFRKYAYAVYYCIYLKYFSRKFTKNRYQQFKEKFLINYGQRVKDQSYKITKTIQTIDLLKLVINSPQQIKNFSSLELKISSQQKSPSNIIPSKKQTLFKKSLNFTNFYIQQLQKILLNQKFIDVFAEVIGIGTLNQSFFMDDLIIPQQIQLITFSQKKGFAKINPPTQKILLMIYIFVKHALFKILFKLRQKKYLESKFKKEEYEKYQDEKDEIYEFLQTASTVIYTLVNDLYLEHIQEEKPRTNYDKLKKRFKIQPAKILSTPNCPKNLKQTTNFQQLIVGVDKIQQLKSLIEGQKFQEYLGFLVVQIQNLIDKFSVKVKYINNLVYNRIKKLTLNQKYIIFEGIKSEENQNIKSSMSIGRKTSQKNLNTSININKGVRFSDTSLGNITRSKKSRL